MNSAFTHHQAARKAGRLARFAALACALVLGAGSAYGQQHGDRGDRRDDQQSQRFRLPPQDRDGRDDMRAYEEQRRAQQQYQQQMQEQRDQHDNRRGSRMTPDERRDLRRQINEAGMDLYPQRR